MTDLTVSPITTANDTANHLHGDRKGVSQLAEQCTIGSPLANCNNVGFGQLGASVARSARHQIIHHGMIDVLSASYIFQIVGAIVCFVAINMIDFVAQWTRAKKGSGDELMDDFDFANTIHAKRDSEIISLIGALAQHPPQRFAPYSPQTRHAVAAFIRHDGSPFLSNGFKGKLFKRHGGLLSSSLSPGPHGASTSLRPALYQPISDRKGARRPRSRRQWQSTH